LFQKLNYNEDHILTYVHSGSFHWHWYALLFNCSCFFFKDFVFLHKFLFVVGNEGPMKVVEGKNCDVKLYDYCEENCFIDCPKKSQNRAIGFCNNDFRPPICMCRYRC